MLDVSFLKTNIFSLNNVDAKKVLDSLEDDKLEADDRNESPRKRRRLDDFTPQERMIRRKLKNRVAAQSARDRKRERMDQLEKIVIRLESENKELKKSNEELRSGMHQLIAQNEELRMKLGLHDSKHNIKKISNTNECHIISTPVVPDHDHIVKSKQEGPDAEHASLKVSLPQKFQALLVSLITMWLANPRLANYLTSLSPSKQETVLKIMLLRKLRSKQSKIHSKTNWSLQTLLQMNLWPLIQTCLKKRQMSYLNSVRISNTWWGSVTIL